MPTNISKLPLVGVAIEVATNESWRDGVAFTTAGSITGYATAGNAGNGAISGLSVTPGAYIGEYTVTLTSPTQFRAADPDGYTIGAGNIGVQFVSSGVTFTISAGATPFAVGDSFTITTLPQPLDITGIRFVMAVRAAASPISANLLISADTQIGTLVNGGATGVLGFAVPLSVMSAVAPSPVGSDYVFDVLAIADGDQRRCIKGTVAVVPGVTLPVM